MKEDRFDMDLRKSRKEAGVAPQRRIVRVVRAGTAKGPELPLETTLAAQGDPSLAHVVEPAIHLA